MLLRDSNIKGWHAALALVLGLLGTLAGLYLAIHLVGPLVRAWFGPPRGFRQDYATREAWLEARMVQFLSLGAVFLLVGILSGLGKRPKPFASSLWAVNPFSVGVGCWAFQRLSSSGGPGEYFGYLGLALLALTSPFVLAPCMLLGTRIGSRFRPADGGGYHYDAPA